MTSALSVTDSRLTTTAAGIRFSNPVVLAAGTAGYGRELAGVMDLSVLGGLVTKAVSVAPRPGAPSPRVAEFAGGMINAVGLANPGLEAVRREHLPWLRDNLGSNGPRVVVNVVGSQVEDFATVIAGIEETLPKTHPGVDAYELNVSCPNVKAGGMEFGADRVALQSVVRGARAATKRPLFVKLSPTLGDIAATASAAMEAGADAISLVNTIPGLVIDVARRRPALGFGSGGVSGTALMPVGVLATWKVHRALPDVPLLGIGGVESGQDVVQYLMAGASLVGVGTAAMRDPRAPARIVAELARWCANENTSVAQVIGTLEWSP
jgi:dihydroorotate dehydrogenase (NAD+) catalytic subunit